jgi:hypothetical protein
MVSSSELPAGLSSTWTAHDPAGTVALDLLQAVAPAQLALEGRLDAGLAERCRRSGSPRLPGASGRLGA